VSLLATSLGSCLQPTAPGHQEAPQLPGFLQKLEGPNRRGNKTSFGLPHLKEARGRQGWERDLSQRAWHAARGDRRGREVLERKETGQAKAAAALPPGSGSPASTALCSAVVVPLTTAGTRESNRTGTCCRRPPRSSRSEACTALSAKAGETKQVKRVTQPSHPPAAPGQGPERCFCGRSSGRRTQPCPCHRHVPLLGDLERVPLRSWVSSRTCR